MRFLIFICLNQALSASHSMSTRRKSPLSKNGADFAAFVKAGKKLGDLHCGYEKAKKWDDCVVDMKPVQGELGCAAGETHRGTYAVTKMRFAKKENPVDENKNGKLDRWELEDRSRIIYIVDLILKVVTVSMETQMIVTKLPRLEF